MINLTAQIEICLHRLFNSTQSLILIISVKHWPLANSHGCFKKNKRTKDFRLVLVNLRMKLYEVRC